MNGVSLDACGECGALLAPGNGFDLHLQWHRAIATAATAVSGKPEPAWLTIPDAAAELNISPRVVYEHVYSGRLPHADLGTGSKKLIRVSRADLETFITQRQETR